MAYNFKSIADVEVIAEPAESANVLIEEDGVIKKAPKAAVGGGETSGCFAIAKGDGSVRASEGLYENLYAFLTEGKPIRVDTYGIGTDGIAVRVFQLNGVNFNSDDSDQIDLDCWDGMIFFIRKNGNHSYYYD